MHSAKENDLWNHTLEFEKQVNECLMFDPLLNTSEIKSVVGLMITDYDRLLLAFSIRTYYFCDQKFQWLPREE